MIDVNQGASRSPHNRAARRSALGWAHLNGVIWAIGNGLVSGTLVIYLALELGAKGFDISLILAAPHLVGALRLATAVLLERWPDRRAWCVVCFLLSSAFLLGIPPLAAPGVLPSARWSLTALVGLWCLFHLFQYVGVVALWSWLGDLAPQRVRGRFIGRREAWMVAGMLLGAVASGLFVYYWQQDRTRPRWSGYAISAIVGSLTMTAAVWPLTRMSGGRIGRSARERSDEEKPAASPASAAIRATDSTNHALRRPAANAVPAQRSAAPFSPPRLAAFGKGLSRFFGPAGPLSSLVATGADRRYRRLLGFACWLSFVQGLTQSPQNVYGASVLKIHLLWMLLMQSGMRIGQFAITPSVGRHCDRHGNRGVMMLSQALTAAGLLFYAIASPAAPWWVIGAWVLWIAFAGLNVGLPNLMLKLAPPQAAGHIGFYFTAIGLAYAASTLLGGYWFDTFRHAEWSWFGGAIRCDFFQASFLGGCVLRAMGLIWLLRIREDEQVGPHA